MISVPVHFTLKDLQYDYDPKQYFDASSSKYQDMPNVSIFDKTNRYEMVLLIIALKQTWNLTSKEDCSKIERLIKLELPDNIRTQLDVTDWIVLHWNKSESRSA